MKISLVLPAYNAEHDLPETLDNLHRGMERNPSFEFELFLVDDASTDRTWEVINDEVGARGLQALPHRNRWNKGLVQTLKETYDRALGSPFEPDYVLKTDTDRDFDQSTVLDRMLPHTQFGDAVIAGVRWREIRADDYPEEYHPRIEHELSRREEVLDALDNRLGITRLDPPSCGTQLYRQDALVDLLQDERIASYDRRWGLDFLMPIVAKGHGHPLTVEQIENGRYDPSRRSEDKVDTQYDSYLETIDALSGGKAYE